jgi:hypothetical protein
MEAAQAIPIFGGDTNGLFLVETLRHRDADLYFVCEPILVSSVDAVVDWRRDRRIRIGSGATDVVIFDDNNSIPSLEQQLRVDGVASLRLMGALRDQRLWDFNLERLIKLLSNQVGDAETKAQVLVRNEYLQSAQRLQEKNSTELQQDTEHRQYFVDEVRISSL